MANTRGGEIRIVGTGTFDEMVCLWEAYLFEEIILEGAMKALLMEVIEGNGGVSYVEHGLPAGLVHW